MYGNYTTLLRNKCVTRTNYAGHIDLHCLVLWYRDGSGDNEKIKVLNIIHNNLEINHKHSLSLTHLTFLHNSADIESMLFKANIVAKTLLHAKSIFTAN